MMLLKRLIGKLWIYYLNNNKIVIIQIIISFRDTASETVRTLLVYGYNLDPPAGETNEGN